MKERIYVCHTFYHVYVACLKELHILHEMAGHGTESNGNNAAGQSFATAKAAKGSSMAGRATLVLSKMSNHFGSMVGRARESGLFEEVVEFDEKEDTFFPELTPLRTDTGSIVTNMRNRIRFCREFARLEADYVPVNFREYRDIYVFCDSDPIGYYLNGNHIPYHALEDGLDTIRYSDDARISNMGHFGIKAFMARLGLIHIQNGYSRYCIDMEVNGLEGIKYPLKNFVVVPREELVQELTQSDKDLLLQIFVENLGELKDKLQGSGGVLGSGSEQKSIISDSVFSKNPQPRVLILTDPLCDLQTREQIFRDIIEAYGQVNGSPALVLLKQHPRDYLDYENLFPDVIHLSGNFPMEMMNFISGLSFDRVVSVYTSMDSIHYAKEKVFLGHDFMDKYEDPRIHRIAEEV